MPYPWYNSVKPIGCVERMNRDDATRRSGRRYLVRIGIISDIHDNLWALQDVLTGLTDCAELLCLGDLCAPFTMLAIAEGFHGPVHMVWGNNDGDKLAIARQAQEAGEVTIHGHFAELELGKRKIALTHYPDMAAALARGGEYDLVCHGHDHNAAVTEVGETLLVDPGEVMGRYGTHTYAVYDTDKDEAEIITV
jgi:uncharacterized protein